MFLRLSVLPSGWMVGRKRLPTPISPIAQSMPMSYCKLSADQATLDAAKICLTTLADELKLKETECRSYLELPGSCEKK